MDYNGTDRELEAQRSVEAEQHAEYLKEAEANKKNKPVITDALLKQLESMPPELEIIYLNHKGEWLFSKHTPKINSAHPLSEKHVDIDRVFHAYHVKHIKELGSKK